MKQSDPLVERFKTEAIPVVVKEYHPEKIILFGSRVFGTAREGSDLDVILVSKLFSHIPFIRRMAAVARKIDFPIHVDFFCYSPEEFERVKESSSVLQDAVNFGEHLDYLSEVKR